MLGLSVSRMAQLALESRIPTTRPDGRNYRYRRADVEAFGRIARPTGVPITSEGRAARRAHFNYLGGSTRRLSRRNRLHPIRRELPPEARRAFDVAVLAAAKHAGGRTQRQRHLRRTRAVMLVIVATVRGWNAPARTDLEQQANVVRALKPWLERVGMDEWGEAVF